MPKPKKQGRKTRKHGRCRRSPAHQRYTAESRWARHKAARIRRFHRRHPNWVIPQNVSDDVKRFL